MATLDAELRLLLAKTARLAKSPSTARIDAAQDEPIHIALKFHGDIAAVVTAGFHVGSVVGSIAFGRTTLAGLEALARHPQVEFIEKQRRAHLHLDGSVPNIKANQVRTRSGDNFSGYTGRGVIVGVIDTGIDFRHRAFRKPDGTTRVLKIWDQTLTPEGLESSPDPIADPVLGDAPLDYGVEYEVKNINDTLEGGDVVTRVRHMDTDGHGSHVAGIAAGDGSQNGHCHGAYTYVGVAPEADLMVVRMWGLTKGDTDRPDTDNGVLVDAVLYLMREARRANKPLVINASLGKFTDKMDGTSAISQAIDTALRRNSIGRSIVISAGNESDSGFHAVATVPPGVDNGIHLDFRIHKHDSKTRRLVVLYNGANLEASLDSPVGGANGLIDWVPAGDLETSDTANGVGNEVTLGNDPNRISIEIVPADDHHNRRGTWSLHLRNTGAAPTPVHAFCLLGSSHDDKSPYFKNSVSPRTTLNEYATGFEIIAVGSHREGGRLSGFSGRGPTLDIPPRAKPELSAPGEDIASVALAKERGGCERCLCNCCRDFYIDMSGTSMSAPHVAGVIALMLHKNPNLTHVQIRNLLTANTAAKPADSTPDEDAGWGSGHLDGKKVVDAVAQINPPVVNTVRAASPLTQLRDRLISTERGPALLGVIEQYANEVWSLIQGNRRVATIWHRCKGPVWVRLALKAAYAPDSELPLEVDGLSLRDSVLRFAGALKRFGSSSLRQAVQTWEPELAQIDGTMSLSAIIAAVGKPASAAEKP